MPDVERFAAHLDREFPAIWSFGFDPTIDATNCRAEQAIRPIVVTRKVCGGNRSSAGADSQQILASVIRTASQRDVNPHVVASMLHQSTPSVVADLTDPLNSYDRNAGNTCWQLRARRGITDEP